VRPAGLLLELQLLSAQGSLMLMLGYGSAPPAVLCNHRLLKLRVRKGLAAAGMRQAPCV
jgi:hypothetical protein